MKILIATNVRPVQGGVGVYINGLMHGFHAVGENADVLSVFGLSDEFKLAPGGLTSRLDRILKNDAAVMLLYNAAKAILWFRASAALQKVRYDVVHCQDVCAFNAIYPVAVARNIPIVLTIHGLLGRGGLDGRPPSGERLQHFFESEDRAAFERAKTVFTLSDYAADYVRSLAPAANIKLATGLIESGLWEARAGLVDPATTRERRKKQFRLIAVARLVPRKGVEFAIRALALLPPRVVLTIVGGGPELESLQELAQSLGVADRTTFTGRVPHERVFELYREADVALAPCIQYDGNREEAPISILEAMASGKPVIASGAVGLSSLVRECGFLIDERDSKAIAQGVEKFMKDDELYESCVRLGLELISKRHDVSVVAKAYIDGYGLQAHE